MPIVPFAKGAPQAQPQEQPPSEEFALMAAAQMHAEGRLVEPKEPVDVPATDQ